MQKRMRPLLGTFVEIGLADTGCLTSAQIDQAFAKAFSRIEKIQHSLSFHSPDSELTQLNSAPEKWITLHKDSYDCLLLAKIITRLTQYRFNLFLGQKLIDLNVLPSTQLALSKPIDACNPITIECLQLKKNQARLVLPTLICLDGIAKGFAVDKAIIELQKAGVASAWVNAGGDIRVFGNYVMPIHQKNHLDEIKYLGGLQNAAIATSTSLSTKEFPGVLLSPDGQQLANASWTVIAHTATRADALTKVAANTALTELPVYLQSFAAQLISI